jgi:ribosomal protein S18 acetylase RimI-like enzyme
MPRKPVIRLAGAADVPALAPLFDAYRQFYDQPADLALATHFLQQRLARGESRLWMACGPASVAGGAGPALGLCQCYPSFCSVLAQPIFVLYDLFVSPDARGQGVATALMSAAADLARAEGRARLDLSTARDNLAAQALYEALGWQRDEVFLTYSLTLTPRAPGRDTGTDADEPGQTPPKQSHR